MCGNRLKMGLNCCYRIKINFKVLAIPILTAIVPNIIKTDAFIIRTVNALVLTFSL